jgi:hypothetical protein
VFTLSTHFLARAFSTRRAIAGFQCYIFAPSAQRILVEQRLAAALSLLADTRPRWFARLHTIVSAIETGPLMTIAGGWVTSRKAIVLDVDFLCNVRQPGFRIASTIVHEGTHARIDQWGVPYDSAHRIRIERACLRQEDVFLRELPADDTRDWALAHLAERNATAQEVWSPAHADELAEAALKKVGVPPRLVGYMMRFRRWRLRGDAV